MNRKIRPNSTTLVFLKWVLLGLVGLGVSNGGSQHIAAAWQDKASGEVSDDWNREWFADRAEQDSFMRGLKMAAVENPELHGSVAVINDLISGQPLGATGQRFGLVSDGLGVLANESFRAELDISDSQYSEMQTLQNEWSARLGKELQAANRSDMSAILHSITNSQTEVERSLQSVLLPHQQRRLEQAIWEQQLRRKSLATLLGEDPLKDAVGVTDRQARELLELESKLNEELALEVARLQHAARLKILASLNSEQQTRAEEILGPALKSLAEKPFNPKPSKETLKKK
ncbi:MAG: hypothetical protein Q8M16_09995 [Pirellulaceae bacterium]|nr:hypothetical protein [Pirellulaceae bacterium]